MMCIVNRLQEDELRYEVTSEQIWSPTVTLAFSSLDSGSFLGVGLAVATERIAMVKAMVNFMVCCLW